MEIYQLKITLMDVRPPIWRRVHVQDSVSLGYLHRILQTAMGWEDCHLHRFLIGQRRGGKKYGQTEDQGDDENAVTLRHIVRQQHAKVLYYEYDFGDGWVHEVAIEESLIPREDVSYPVCTNGARRCPPEDCGGPGGYKELLNILRDPRHPDHAERLRWASVRFDPEAFDLKMVNERLRQLMS